MTFTRWTSCLRSVTGTPFTPHQIYWIWNDPHDVKWHNSNNDFWEDLNEQYWIEGTKFIKMELGLLSKEEIVTMTMKALGFSGNKSRLLF
jgi:hypothetical protein